MKKRKGFVFVIQNNMVIKIRTRQEGKPMTVIENNQNQDVIYIQECKTFKWWKRQQMKYYLQMGIVTICLEIFIIGLGLKSDMNAIRTADLIFGIVALSLCFVLAIYFIYKGIKYNFVQVERAYYGIVTEKNRHSKSRRVKNQDNRAYFIVAEVGTEIMEGKCEYNTYKNVSKGDRVIIFDVDLDKNVTYAIYC